MGQIFSPASSGFPKIVAIDRLKASNAGAGQSGNRVFMVGQNAGDNSTVSDLVIIGNSSAKNGWTDNALANSVVIGPANLPNNVDATTDLVGGLQGSVIVIGGNNFPAAPANVRMTGLIAIGAGIGNAFIGSGGGDAFGRNILIGDNIWQNNLMSPGFGSADNIIVGYKSGLGSNTDAQWIANTVVGSRAAAFSGGGTLSNNVFVGALTCTALSGSCQGNVVIGWSGAQGLFASSNNTMVGGTTTIQNPVNGCNTVVGQASGLLTGDYNSIFGQNCSRISSASRTIIIGRQADVDITVAQNDQFILGTYDGTTQRSLLYGRMDLGNLVVGNSTQATNRDLPGTNILKLLNGTATGNPVGGGMFYATAGRLLWRDSAGVDTAISLNAAGQLANTVVNYTNNAAAQVATILNSPTAGNPTKWIPINDNGTIRNIPAW